MSFSRVPFTYVTESGKQSRSAETDPIHVAFKMYIIVLEKAFL